MVEIWGLDVARFGDDKNVLTRRTKRTLLPIIDSWGGKDLMQTTGIVVAKYKALPERRRPQEILVDSIGMGGGVVDRLRELGLPARGINVSETESSDPLYRNVRTALYFGAKEWLDGLDVSLPKGGECSDEIEQLISELTSIQYGFTSSGKMMAEPKKDVKKRLRKSPDFADSFVLTFASEPATLLHGTTGNSGWSSSWNQPIERKLTIV
jgi:hypothetical protein